MSQPGLLSESDVLVRLSYLDKRFAVFERLEASVARLARLQIILSLLVIALVVGLVSADESLELTGINLELPLWAFVGGGAIAVAITTALCLLQSELSSDLNESLSSGYAELGYSAPKEDAAEGIGLNSTVFDAMLALRESRGLDVWLGFLYALVVLGVLLVLPVAAQAAALIKLGRDFGWAWHVWLPLGGSLLLTLVVIAWSLAPDRDSSGVDAEQGKSTP